MCALDFHRGGSNSPWDRETLISFKMRKERPKCLVRQQTH